MKGISKGLGRKRGTQGKGKKGMGKMGEGKGEKQHLVPPRQNPGYATSSNNIHQFIYLIQAARPTETVLKTRQHNIHIAVQNSFKDIQFHACETRSRSIVRRSRIHNRFYSHVDVTSISCFRFRLRRISTICWLRTVAGVLQSAW